MSEQFALESSSVAPRLPAGAVTQSEIDQRVYDLYDEYCHGRIDSREFLKRAAALGAAGLVMAQALFPDYARAQTISFTDPRIKATYVTYPSPGGNSGSMRGYLVQPSGSGVPRGHTLPRTRVRPDVRFSTRSFILYHTLPFHSNGMARVRLVSGCQLSIQSFWALPASTSP